MSALLEVDSVSKSFGDLRAVDRVSFEVRAGEVFGFLGPNGAGKTTTLRMIMSITRPDSGAIRFDGGAQLDRGCVGYLPEERGLYEDAPILRVLTYLGTLRGLSQREAAARGMAWLERLGLADRAKHKVNTLSKGNQQKLQFAGAVLHGPALAVLDEAFSGLDPVNQELFIGFIRELGEKGTAVLLSAHHLDLVERLCDRFALIASGRIVLDGTLETMRRRVAGSDAREMLTLTLRPRAAAAADPARLSAALDRAGLGSRTIEKMPSELLRVVMPLEGEADLGPILAAVAPEYAIVRSDMRPMPLHEIYLRAVGGNRAEVAARLEEAVT